MFTAPVEGLLENFMELGDAGFAGDQERRQTRGLTSRSTTRS
jgi:hypothetical protein